MSVSVESRKPLPTGAVTLFFADVEGSTRLLLSLGDRYAPVLARMRELVRETTSKRGGHEIDWAGDGVFLAFERARDAVAAAADLQRALADEPWAPEEALRLRIGIHTGEPDLEEEGYVGLDVHIAARVCGAAHGGQVIVSRTTRDLVGDDVRGGVSFQSLGSHRLKDVPSPEQLFQLLASDLPETFPPLRSLGGATLPALHHRLVGRRKDLTATLSLLARPEVRLVTITGPGGTGKSRLALEAAALTAVQRPVHLVALAPVSDPELVPTAIARTLGVRESTSRPLTENIADALAGTSALLFLDNFEHLLAAAPAVAALLNRAPDLDVLTTSRVPLRLSGEHIVPLDPLTIYDASTLFAELAAARGVVLREDTLPAVREICRRLDGLPLAIELVAARLAVLPPAQLLKALEEGLTLEMEGPVDLPERQRTLRATIDWSYGLLSESQRELHQALAVFAGGCTLEDGRAVAGADSNFLADLEAIVVGSLLRSEVTDGQVRFFMLETVRENAVSRLAAAGKLDDLRRKHADRFVELALAAEEALEGPAQAECLERLELELDNLRAMLDWCLASGRVEDALRAASALSRFWRAHSHLTEARRWLAQGLARAEGLPAEVRARALWTAAHEAMMQSDYPAAVPALEDALRLFRELRDDRYAVFALCELARALSSQDELDRAQHAAEEALSIAETAGDERAASAALDTLAMVAGYCNRRTEAQTLSERSLALRRSLGDPLLIAASANTLGLAAMRAGDLDTAERALEECLELSQELGEKVFIAAALCSLGEIALSRDLPAPAAERLLESLRIYRELGDERACAECVHALGGVAAAQGQPDVAARLWGAAEALRERHGAALTPDEKAVERGFVPSVAAELGAEELARVRSEGRSLDLDGLETLARRLAQAHTTSIIVTAGTIDEGGRDGVQR